MTIIEMAAELGRAIKADPVVDRLNKTAAAYEADEQLLALTQKYNAFSAQLSTLQSANEIDDAAVNTVEEALSAVYDEIMENPTMVEYTDAKAAADELMESVSNEISFQITGKRSCGHESCEGCSGCN